MRAVRYRRRVSIVGNEFPAIHTVANGAAACMGGEVKINLTADHQKINVDGMSGNPAEYSSAIYREFIDRCIDERRRYSPVR